MSDVNIDFFGSIGILLGEDAVLNIEKTNIANHIEDIYDFNYMFEVYDGASLNLSNLAVGPYYGFLIDLFSNASVIIKHTTFAGTLQNDFGLEPDGVSVFDNSNLVMLNVTFSDVVSDVFYLDESTASILDSVFLNNEVVGNTFNGAILSLENSVLYGFPNAGLVDYGTSILSQNIISVHDNYIVGDTVTSTGVEFYAEADTEDSYTDFSNNAIYFNEFGAQNNAYNGLAVNMENNWWGSATGPYNASQNENGEGNEVSNDINFTPYLSENPLPTFGTPKVFQFTQYKRDGEFILPEGETLVSDTVSYGATIQSFLFDAMLEVELKPVGDSFNGSDTLLSSPVANNQKATVFISDLTDGEYHVRYRVKTTNGLQSPWKEFGEVGNTDLVVHQVPHYTQINSPVPTYGLWSSQNYASNFNPTKCATSSNPNLFTIGSCGCALTSAVMLLRYYGITEGIDGLDVNPSNLNNWLNENDGYTNNGSVRWERLLDYSDGKFKFDISSMDLGQDFIELNNQLNLNKPTILNVKGFYLSNGHFLVATNKLENSYEIRDPSWYFTETLNDFDPNNSNFDFITPKDYNNEFVGIRAFEYSENPNILTQDNLMSVYLGSPADFVVINELGQRTGKDPITGVEYNEIPNAYYGEEVYESPFDPIPVTSTNKIAYILEPNIGEYDIQVIGTGNGDYSLSTYADVLNGEDSSNTSSITFDGGITNYIASYSEDNGVDINLEFGIDIQSPKVDISLDTLNWSTIIDGIDTTGEPNLNQTGNNYTFTDSSNNTTSFVLTPNLQTNFQKKYSFSNFSQNGQSIAVPLTRIEYTRQLGQQNILKKLNQKIIIQGVVTIEAVYNENMGKTIITKTYPNPVMSPVVTEIFDGVKIIHLTAVNGELGYEW